MSVSSEGSGVELHVPKKFTLGHERDSGAPCLKCGPEKCVGGLDLHFWRKICKNCKCKLEEHEIKSHEEEAHKLVVHRLFSESSPVSHIREYFRKLEQENQQPKTEYVKQFAWVPPAVQQAVLVKYMEALPPTVVPKIGSDGAKSRRKQMMFQLPIYDHDERYCGNMDDEERQKMDDFCDMRNNEALGVGDIREKTNPATKWTCFRCNKNMNGGEVAVFASRAGEEKCWHPGCFVCCICNNLLVDLIYFFKEGNIYCGRHYAECYKPRCAACDELIFASTYTDAEDKYWHRNHFCCFDCDVDLGGQKYVVHGGHPTCFECYGRFYAKICMTCGQLISADAKRIEYEGDFWHAESTCFCCARCRKSLLGQQFMRLQGGRDVYCSVECAKNRRS